MENWRLCILQKTNGSTLPQNASSSPRRTDFFLLLVRALAAHIVPEAALSCLLRPLLDRVLLLGNFS